MGSVSILVVENEEGIRNLLHTVLTTEGYRVTVAENGDDAIRFAQDMAVDVLLTDLKLPDTNGLTILEQMLRIDPTVTGIVMTGHGTIDTAVRAMKSGAFEFITKPFEVVQVTEIVKKAVQAQSVKRHGQSMKKSVRDQYRLERLIGTSSQIRDLVEFVEKVADTDSTVLIQGESGTGKEMVARMLHFNSLRKARPLVPVNCGAIPENLLESELFGHERGAFTGALHTRLGRFELANGGTIFLDEIGELSPSLQVKLLRVLQERSFERVGGTKTIHVDVRVLAATNQDLERAVQDKRFRQDLYYRLHVIPVTIPPLRERCEDIPDLVRHFVAVFNRTKHTTIESCSPDAMTRLTEYAWPGNVRELEHMIERVVVLKKTGRIEASDLPERVLQRTGHPEASKDQFIRFSDQGVNLSRELEQFENRLIVEALRQANGITSKAAQLLQLNRTTLVEKLKRKGFAPKSLNCIAG
ncbi:Acetoacetate metabolism regulatory protein AtoC [Nitrospira sp. KM1]|uniref:sigma-54-dependent transcriptional regulator n=1 Tax=Nitrospira sp. KM1 TaxID=1936990 RepID=UPI0013A7829C|nr:sigma-54 dependent transcriptional regulator [Nitrospira sp. KM1]BCA54825.1 Acetoacetate metabolism regulatory protein AtoC [Nitrospira sp. KM1]